MHKCEYLKLFLDLDAYIYTVENENHKFDLTLIKAREREKEYLRINTKVKKLYKDSLNVNDTLIDQNSKLRQVNKILKQERKQLNKIVSNFKFSVDVVEGDEESEDEEGGESENEEVEESEDDDYVQSIDIVEDEPMRNHTRADKYSILKTYAKVKKYMISKNTSLSKVLYSMNLCTNQVEHYRYKFTQLKLSRNTLAHPDVNRDEEIKDPYMLLQCL
jgi:hypothetical protein